MILLSFTDNENWALIVLLILYAVIAIGVAVREWYFLRKEKMRIAKTEGIVNGKAVIDGMLKEAGIEGVTVKPIDALVQRYYYSPKRREIVVSTHAYYGSSHYEVMRAASTAANVVQREEAFGLIDLFLRLAPFMEWMSRMFPIVILVGIYCMAFNPKAACLVILFLWLLLLVLSLVMLPVRRDASKRGCEWLLSHGYVDEQDRASLERIGRYTANYNLALVALSVFALVLIRVKLWFPSDKSV